VYPHLLVDLYNAQSFPSECANEYFFYQCKKKLTGTGFLAINLANPKDHRPILQLIKKHFSNTLIIPIKKTVNAVILASNHPSNNEFIQKILDSGEIKKIAFVASWGCVGIIQ
jgi:hypothetical protein